MGEVSDRLLKLRPVSFRYKGHADDPVQFGLIAEEVEKVLPELVVKNSAGEPETVMYHEMPAMLLNEIQKQQKQIDSQSETIGRQQAEIDVLKEELRRLETRLSEHPRGAD
jgi:trimeric autotransporter adhesin